MEIKNHLLKGDNIEEKKTPNLYFPPQFKLPDLPDSIVIHYTAMSKAEDAVKALTNKNISASAHLVVARDGKIYQLAPFNYRTWHAGKSAYQSRSGYNHYSIGIEIDNLGWLEPYNGFYSRPELLDYNVKLKENEVIQAEHKNPRVRKKYWHKYTDIQIQRTIEICKLLVQDYSIEEIVGHDDIAPDRKQDPGPAFPMDYFVTQVLYSDRSDDDEPAASVDIKGSVTATKLNIRSGPSLDANAVAKPLPQGTEVRIVGESGDWYHVFAEVEGWVYKKHIN